jgi:hypothetical protein
MRPSGSMRQLAANVVDVVSDPSARGLRRSGSVVEGGGGRALSAETVKMATTAQASWTAFGTVRAGAVLTEL